MISNGWHKVSGYDCYVEDGVINRSVSVYGTHYCYRKSRYGGYDKCNPTISAFRSAVYRGTMIVK